MYGTRASFASERDEDAELADVDPYDPNGEDEDEHDSLHREASAETDPVT